MTFEMVLEMAMACGAVYMSGDDYMVSGERIDEVADLSGMGADCLGSLCVMLGYDVVACGCSFDDLLCELLEVEGEDFDQWELGFSGDVDGEHYGFLVDDVD